VRRREVKGVLFIGGAGPVREALAGVLAEAACVAAADSGLERAIALGVEPDLIVGDMDSITDRSLLERFPPERVVVFPVAKDETDTEIGLRMLQERGCDEVTIAGGGGGRIDHLLAVAALFERARPPRRWLTDKAECHLVDGTAVFTGWLGSIVSVFPIGSEASGLASEGLQWPLDGLRLRRGWPGISNVAVGDPVRVRVSRGRLLVIRLWEGDRRA
jgi:thiamine pyrophosphokinase